jgi:hypothetical protein
MSLRSNRSTRWGSALCFVALSGAPHDAHAGEPSSAAVEEGRARFTRGVTLFRASDYRAALLEFNRAYAVAPSFRIQFNIGQTCAELLDHACAAKAFEIFLADGGKQVPPAQRVVAERELRRLNALVGRVRVRTTAGAEVTVDGVAAGTGPLSEPVLVSAGRRTFVATKAPFAAVSQVIDVPAGDTVELALPIVEAGGETPAPAASAPSRTPFWIGVGITSALAVVTVTTGVLALGAKSDLDATVGRFGASTASLDEARSKVDRLALVTDLFAAATLVGAGVTTFLFFQSRPTAPKVGLGPGSISVTHAF